MFFFRKKQSPNYAKIITVTLACVAGAAAVACLVYFLFKKLFSFCDQCDCDEEFLEEECADCEVCIDEPEAILADAE